MMRDDTLSARLMRVLVPVAAGLLFLLLWEAFVTIREIPRFVLPAPSVIFESLVQNFGSLMGSLWVTLRVTIAAFLLAVVGGVGLAIVFSQSRAVETVLFPYAVALQVTPVVSIAPLIIIWVGYDRVEIAVLILAWIVAFFPILSNTVVGLRSTDHNLRDLFTLYRASPWQRLRLLLAPSALPYFMAALKIAGGLSLIGAVVAEFVAGATGANTGLASRIIESSFRNEIPRMFAALVLVSLLGVAIFLMTAFASKLVLGKWHESEIKRET